MKTLLSLFDTTGHWPYYFAENGWNVIHVDIQNWCKLDIKKIRTAEIALEVFGDIHGIVASPPCTDYCVSGARWWEKKDANGETAMSNKLVEQTLKLVDLYWPTDMEYDDTFFFAIENPVGRLPRIFPALGKPLMYFHPHQFSRWNDISSKDYYDLEVVRDKRGVGLTKHDIELIWRSEAYTKKTGLWGCFNPPEAKPMEPVLGTPNGSIIHRYGGKSIKTKNVRSATPLGFARAFYEANKDWRPATWDWPLRKAA